MRVLFVVHEWLSREHARAYLKREFLWLPKGIDVSKVEIKVRHWSHDVVQLCATFKPHWLVDMSDDLACSSFLMDMVHYVPALQNTLIHLVTDGERISARLDEEDEIGEEEFEAMIETVAARILAEETNPEGGPTEEAHTSQYGGLN
jgi:hypothetical protein